MDRKTVQPLPIDIHKSTFQKALKQHKPIVVVAPTGSGKSTRLPFWLQESSGGKVLVIEPRRIACRSLAGYLSQQRNQDMGQEIGFNIRFENRSSAKTKILFVTPGIALKMLQQSGSWDYQAVLIDEFHERGWQTDLIYALLLEKFKRSPKQFSFVITSATIDAEKIIQKAEAIAIHTEGRTYPIEMSYQNAPDNPSLYQLEERIQKVTQSLLKDTQETGNVLVFLPGKREIDKCMNALQPFASTLEIIPVHGSIPTSKLSDTFSRSSKRRRLYLSTNIAETSLTLPGVTTVIDFGLARQKMHRAGHSILALAPIANDAMTQRAGRAGRVAPGKCIRMWSQKYKSIPSTPPELERIELDDLLLAVASCGVPIIKSELLPWLTAPPEFAWKRSKDRLLKLKAIDSDGRLTNSGEMLSQLPVSTHEARLLAEPNPTFATLLVDLVAILQLRSSLLLGLFNRPTEQREEIEEQRRKLFVGCKNEVSILLKSLRAGKVQQHGLNPSALYEARKISKALRKRLYLTPIDPTQDTLHFPDDDSFAYEIIQRWPEAAFVLRERAKNPKKKSKRSEEPWGNGQEEILLQPFTLPFESDEQPKKAIAGIILEHEWIGGLGTGFKGRGRKLLSCSIRTLAKAGLGEVEYGKPEISFKSNGKIKIFAHAKRSLAGTLLSSEKQQVEGKELRQIAANLIKDNRLYKKTYEQLLDHLSTWELLRDWPKPEEKPAKKLPPQPEEPEAYLSSKLKELGVEQVEDLELIDGTDLLPDLEELTGWTDFELRPWFEDFPRTWRHQGSLYSCQIHPKRRMVFIEPLNSSAKKAKIPDKMIVPRFRGFSVVYKKASRKIKIR